MIRVVPTGDLGLDVLLGGGWRLIKRFEDRESATVILRGGSGAGKTLMGIQVALELAKALGGDVAVGCVEILPTEYVAQLQSARPSLPQERVAMLPASPSSADGPRVFVGLLDLAPDAPDLVTALESLDGAVKAAGGRPVAFIVDSLIEGYGLGASMPRIDVDDVLKFAARYGYALVLCEEVVKDEPSPWVFAADTVLQLGVESRERGRWIEVRKHRFGASATGRHELILATRQGPVVIPGVGAWMPQANTVHRSLGLDTERTTGLPSLGWSVAPTLTGTLVLIASTDPHLARLAARWFTRSGRQSDRAFHLMLDSVSTGPARWDGETLGATIPTSFGPDRALRWMVEQLASVVGPDGEPTIDRLLVGDLGSIFATPDPREWIGVLRTLAQLVAPYSLPVVTYAMSSETAQDGLNQFSACAEIDVRLPNQVWKDFLEGTINDRIAGTVAKVRIPVTQQLA